MCRLFAVKIGWCNHFLIAPAVFFLLVSDILNGSDGVFSSSLNLCTRFNKLLEAFCVRGVFFDEIA